MSVYAIRTLQALVDIAVPAQPLRAPLPACPCTGTPCQTPGPQSQQHCSRVRLQLSAALLCPATSHAHWWPTSQPTFGLTLGWCPVSGAGRWDEPWLADLEAHPPWGPSTAPGLWHAQSFVLTCTWMALDSLLIFSPALKHCEVKQCCC